MPKRKQTKTKHLGQDRKGRFFRNLGWTKSPAGRYSQRKFYLGHDEDHARLAAARLESLWRCIEDNHQRDVKQLESGVLVGERPPDVNQDVKISFDQNHRSEFEISPGRPIWTELTLTIAESIRQGAPIAKVPLEFVRKSRFCESGKVTPTSAAAWLVETRQNYPMVHLEIEDGELGKAAESKLRSQAKVYLQEGQRLAAEPLTNHRLHHAIDAYRQQVRKNWVDVDGESTEWSKTKCRQLDFIERNTANLDLAQLGGPSIDAILETLRKRPPALKTGRPCSKRHAQNCMKEFGRFLKWLDESTAYLWAWPTDYEFKTGNVAGGAPSESSGNPVLNRKRNKYSVSELKTLYDFATPIQRLYLLLGLNCGFGNAELCSLSMDEIFIRQQHPQEEELEFGSTERDSWIARLRTKTDVLATWKLWPETTAGIDWWLRYRAQICQEWAQKNKRTAEDFSAVSKNRFLVTANGKPAGEKTRRTGKIPNSWNSLIKRVMDHHPSFKNLSFGKLRKTGASDIRLLGGNEIASIYLAHGKPYGNDSELEAYAERPFARLFQALEDYHDRLAPLWETVETPFPDCEPKKGGQSNLAPDTARQIKKLKSQGVNAKSLAADFGIHVSTVYRILG